MATMDQAGRQRAGGHPVVLCGLLLSLAALQLPATAGTDLIMEDGFEARCASGPAPVGSALGELGPAPPGDHQLLACVELRVDANDPVTAFPQVANGVVAVAEALALQDDDLARVAVVSANGRQLAHQLRVLSRWGGPLQPAAGQPSRPIRWLQVLVPSALGTASTARYELRLYPAPVAADDVEGLRVSALGAGRFRVDNRWLETLVDVGAVSVVESLRVRAPVNQPEPALYSAVDDGPQLSLAGVDGQSFPPQPLTPVVDSSEWVEQGPLRATLYVEGHFHDSNGRSLCQETSPAYERLRWSATWRWFRNSPDVELSYQVGNTCSDGVGLSWTDNTATIAEAGWRMSIPFEAVPPLVMTHTAADGPRLGESFALLAQDRGGGAPWRRQARNQVGPTTLTAEMLQQPALAAVTSRGWVSAVHAWQRYREPQALRLEQHRLQLQVLSEPQIVGEGKMLWFRSLLRVQQPPASSAELLQQFPAQARSLLLAAERPMLLRDLAGPGAVGLLPALHFDAGDVGAALHQDFLEHMHEATVGDSANGQWQRHRIYGSQIWPDVPFEDRFGAGSSAPSDFDGRHNYWNPAGSELEAFLRSGEPRWVWDFALPALWLQAHTAYLNQGAERHGRSNGTAVTSGGSGDGQWHRANFGSDDYSYNRGLHLAYALWPEPALQARFRDGGLQMVERYAVPQSQQAQRDPGLEAVTPERQQIQHYELIALCAEFAAGEAGRLCHQRLLQILAELEQENFRAGLICQGDLPDPLACVLPQQFMANALIYPFFDRMVRMYSGAGLLADTAQMLEDYPRRVMELNQAFDGSSFRPDRDWLSALECQLDGVGGVQQCSAVDTGDGVAILAPNRPHTLWPALNAAVLGGDASYCAAARSALAELSQTAGAGDLGVLQEYADAGWWKGAAQVMQGLNHAIALAARCP